MLSFSAFSTIRICCFSLYDIILHWIFWGFGLLVWQNKDIWRHHLIGRIIENVNKTYSLTTLFSLFLSISNSLLLLGHKCQAVWSEQEGKCRPTSLEAHASVSLCYKSFRDTQKAQYILFLFSHPSILSHFIIECSFSEHPITFSTQSERERGYWGIDSTQKLSIPKQSSVGPLHPEKWIYCIPWLWTSAGFVLCPSCKWQGQGQVVFTGNAVDAAPPAC